MYLVCDSVFEEHETPAGHPEGADRAKVIREALEGKFVGAVDWIEPTQCDEDDLLHVHDSSYVNRVKEASRTGQSLDADTPVMDRSYEVALYAAGSSMELAGRCVQDGEAGFGVVRPPGHHAERDRGMGFCLFNNIALAADSVACEGHRVAVVDIDVHHGNGTQQAFYDCSDVLYVSIHQSPLYPGTGSGEETGKGDGEGYTLNFPVSAGSGWESIESFWEGELTDRMAAFTPDVVMVSAGFDAHAEDPVGGLNLLDDDYVRMAEDLAEWADRWAEGRCLGLLEGGYDRSVLSRLVPRVIDTWAGS